VTGLVECLERAGCLVGLADYYDSVGLVGWLGAKAEQNFFLP